MSRIGVLLLNLGTPRDPSPEAVGAYLREFLMDPWVIDIPWPLRWILVNALIVPKRKHDSARLYEKIWTERGSPLDFHLKDLASSVSRNLGERFVIKPVMRYGEPALASAISSLKQEGISQALLLPLYPQYSLAATESSVRYARDLALRAGLDLKIFPPFYDRPGFLDSFAAVAKTTLQKKEWQHLLFSFHGLPERQVKATSNACKFDQSCCEKITDKNRNCYRAQCYFTAREIAQRLGLRSEQYTVCFQSRLGRTPWIQPFTDALYAELSKRGLKKVGVLCPAFVADCLETLEEISIRGQNAFREQGGEELFLVPSLNNENVWARTVSDWITQEYR